MAYGDGGPVGAMAAAATHLRDARAQANAPMAMPPAEGRVRLVVSHLQQVLAHFQAETGNLDRTLDRLCGATPVGESPAQPPPPVVADLDDLDDVVGRLTDAANALSSTAKRAAAL